jgi:Fur family ferric uptake transcriptional regulator
VSVEHIEQATEVFRRFLKSKDLKITRQREILLRRIFEREEHFSAETLEDRVKGDGISKATIYRTLQLLVEADLVRSVALGDDRRMYEHVFGHAPHDHIVCVDCGKVFEFEGTEIGKVESAVARKLGFIPTGHQLRIEGSCEELRKTGRCEREENKLL